MPHRSYQSAIVTFVIATIPFILLTADDKRAAVYELTFALPYLMLALVGFLGEKQNQRRILFLALLYASGYGYLTHSLPEQLHPLSTWLKGQVWAVALPLSLIAMFSVPDGKLWGWRGFLLALALVIPLGSLDWWLRAKGIGFTPWISWHWLGSRLPGLSLLLGTLFVGLTFLTRDRYLKTFRHFTAISLIPIAYALANIHSRTAGAEDMRFELALSFISASTILIYANFQLYWQKVYVDELMGLQNRRALNEKLMTLRPPYVIAMADIDHFKKFNDTYGHEQGDTVLRFVAKHLGTVGTGVSYRYGGEEIAIVFEGQDVESTRKVLDAAREELAKKKFFIRASRSTRKTTTEKDRGRKSDKVVTTHVTVSIGLAGVADHNSARADDVIISADSALYRAKSQGRNCVVAAHAVVSHTKAAS